MRIHVLSDLHLEFAEYQPEAIDADLVVLAGDIHVGVQGVRWAQKAFPDLPVVYVAGNHEYYRNAAPRLTEKLRAEAAGSNVQVLDDEAIEIGGVSVLGCTLWTDLALHGDAQVGEATLADAMMDYRLIRHSPRYRRLRPQDTASFHRRSVHWLRAELLRREGPCVVVSHHAPSPESLDPNSVGDPLSVAYASRLEGLIEECRPAVWIHGHIHRASNYQVGDTRIVCNPRGYPDQPGVGFDPRLVVEMSANET